MDLDDTRWLAPEEMRAWRALLGAQHRLGRVLDIELQAAHGTTLADHEVLILLSEQPEGALRMADLADMLTISRSGLTRRVDRMATAGLVVRERCASDGRGVYARLTGAGWHALEVATPVHVAGVRRHFVEALEAEELALLATALEKVAADAPGPGLVAEPEAYEPAVAGVPVHS